MRETIERHDADAQRSRRADRPHLRLRLDPLRPRRARCCTRRARPTAPATSRTRRSSCGAMKGGLSGGTLASLTGQLDELAREPRAARAVARRPLRAQPRPRRRARPRPRARAARRPCTTTSSGSGSRPFVMASINTRVVRRSNALQDCAYGRRLALPRGRWACGPGMVAPVQGGRAGRRPRRARWPGCAFRPDAGRARPRPALPRRGPEREGAAHRASSRSTIHARTTSGAALRRATSRRRATRATPRRR